MEELLDYQDPEKPKERSRQFYIKTFFYVVLMFIGSGLFATIFLDVPFSLVGAIPSTRGIFYAAFGAMLLAELVKLIYRKVQNIERKLDHPLWFELLEGTFFWWLIFMIILLARNLMY